MWVEAEWLKKTPIQLIQDNLDHGHIFIIYSNNKLTCEKYYHPLINIYSSWIESHQLTPQELRNLLKQFMEECKRIKE